MWVIPHYSHNPGPKHQRKTAATIPNIAASDRPSQKSQSIHRLTVIEAYYVRAMNFSYQYDVGLLGLEPRTK